MIHALPVGHEFDGYRILRVLGAGGFGITYLAEEVSIGRRVAIKEYLPKNLAGREVHSLSIRPLSKADEPQFTAGLQRFRQEAATLVSFEHTNIISVHRYVEANRTAYLVMQYVEGKPLDVLLAGGRTLEESEIEEVIGPILAGLEEVHAARFLHRDIKPSNIYIRMDGRPVLLDFGAARQALPGQDKSVTAIVSEGYAPFEQYDGRGDQGPWTDVYGVGAVLYRCIAGDRPPAAPERVSARLRNAPDPMRPAREVGAGRYGPHLLAAIDHALGVTREERPQSIAALRQRLRGGAPEAGGAKDRASPGPPPAPPDAVARSIETLMQTPPPLVALALVMVGMIVCGASLLIGVGNFEYTLTLDGVSLEKEVGFLSALNWSLGAVLIVPALVAFGLYTVREWPRVLEQLAKRHMVVDATFNAADAAPIKQQWRRFARAIAIGSACAFSLAIAYSLWEYYYIVGQHFLRGAFPPGIALADAYQERDWSVAALIGSGDAQAISKTANGRLRPPRRPPGVRAAGAERAVRDAADVPGAVPDAPPERLFAGARGLDLGFRVPESRRRRAGRRRPSRIDRGRHHGASGARQSQQRALLRLRLRPRRRGAGDARDHAPPRRAAEPRAPRGNARGREREAAPAAGAARAREGSCPPRGDVDVAGALAAHKSARAGRGRRGVLPRVLQARPHRDDRGPGGRLLPPHGGARAGAALIASGHAALASFT
jgi:hypothetical protein